MLRYYLAAFLLLPVFSHGLGFGVQSELDAWSEPVPVAQMIDGWRSTGTGQYAQGRFFSEFYMQADGWRMGWVNRKDYHLQFSRDTARFYGLLEQQELAPGSYPLDLTVNTLESRGVHFTRFIPLPFAELQLGISLLRPFAMNSGELTGLGDVSSSGQQGFEYNLDYRFSHNALLEQDAENTNGLAHALDARVDIPFANGGRLNFRADDVFYRVYWRQIGRSQGCIYQNRVALTVCQQNYVQDSEYAGEQLLSGKYQLQYTQPLHENISAGARLDAWGYYREFSPVLSLHQWQFVYGMQHGLWSLAYAAERIKLSAGLDTAAVNTARQWHLYCDWNVDF